MMTCHKRDYTWERQPYYEGGGGMWRWRGHLRKAGTAHIRKATASDRLDEAAFAQRLQVAVGVLTLPIEPDMRRQEGWVGSGEGWPAYLVLASGRRVLGFGREVLGFGRCSGSGGCSGSAGARLQHVYAGGLRAGLEGGAARRGSAAPACAARGCERRGCGGDGEGGVGRVNGGRRRTRSTLPSAWAP
jgi:hypothetical protein